MLADERCATRFGLHWIGTRCADPFRRALDKAPDSAFPAEGCSEFPSGAEGA